MTTPELINYYADLLILQYRGKPNAFATIQNLVEMPIMDQLPLLVQAAFDLDSAVGVQLDLLGEYVGAFRTGYDFSGPVSLDDDDFRKYIKICIVQNAQGSSLYEIQLLLSIYFPDDIKVFDYKNMQMDYFFESTFGSDQLAEFFVKQKRLPKPMGVQLGSLIKAPFTTEFLGFRTYDFPAFHSTPLNDYAGGFVSGPTMTYDLAIAP